MTIDTSTTDGKIAVLNETSHPHLVPHEEMLEALSDQRRRLCRENDDELIRINAMRDRLWELFEHASAVSRFDWSKVIDEDASLAMTKLQASVDSIQRGGFYTATTITFNARAQASSAESE